jgi:glycosyltransferase involved in cell wall biosynthesis
MEVDAVRKLNTVGATIYSDISPGEHARLLQQCDVYVLCLRDDGISAGHIRLMSALDMSKPVIATRVSGLRDYVEHMVTAFEVPPGDANALRTAVATLLECDTIKARLITEAKTATAERTFSSYLKALSRVCVESSKSQEIESTA